MAEPAYLHAHGQGSRLALKVQPRASRNEIAEPLGSELKIKIAAPPVDDAANQALVRFLAEVLDCPARAVELVRGAASRHKIVQIHGLDPAQVEARLQAARR